MRMKMVTESQTLKDAAKEFLAYKKAHKIRERTLKDYHKYIDPFIAQSSNSMDIDVLRREILEYIADIPTTVRHGTIIRTSTSMPCLHGSQNRLLRFCLVILFFLFEKIIHFRILRQEPCSDCRIPAVAGMALGNKLKWFKFFKHCTRISEEIRSAAQYHPGPNSRILLNTNLDFFPEGRKNPPSRSSNKERKVCGDFDATFTKKSENSCVTHYCNY